MKNLWIYRFCRMGNWITNRQYSGKHPVLSLIRLARIMGKTAMTDPCVENKPFKSRLFVKNLTSQRQNLSWKKGKYMQTLGRFLYGIPFLVFGSFHFLAGSQMMGLVPNWLPFPLFWVYFTGLALFAAGLGIILNRMGYWAALGLAALMFIFALTVHFPKLFNSQTAQLSMVSFLKDIALGGAALAIAPLLRKKF